MKPVDGKAAAYVCENFTCKAPVTDPKALELQLDVRVSGDARHLTLTDHVRLAVVRICGVATRS